MLKPLILLSLIFSSMLHAEVSNLDVVPKTHKELKRMIQVKESEIKYGKENLSVYFSMAQDAWRTSKLSKSVLAGSVALAFAPSVIAWTFGGTPGAILLKLNILSIPAMGAVMGSQSSSSLKTFGDVRNYKTQDGAFERTLDAVEQAVGKGIAPELSGHQYSFIQNELKQYEKKVMEKFDGSLSNAIKDRLTFGSLSADATALLFSIQMSKLVYLKLELKDLYELKSTF